VPVRRISGAGHWVMLDRPDDLNRALDEFLAESK
jgi:pimeloyl-ACP methyl ester carboxylesterase